MISPSLKKKLYRRFVWLDVLGPEAGTCRGFGWKQIMVVSDSCLAIQSVPQPDYLTDGVHGLEVQQIGQDLCLLTRQFCDARRSRFLVAAMLEEVAYLLLQSGHRKIGVATADVLNTLHQRQLTTPVQDETVSCVQYVLT